MAEVFSAAADRQQAGIVYDAAKRMVKMTPELLRRSKIMAATKRIVNYSLPEDADWTDENVLRGRECYAVIKCRMTCGKSRDDST